MKHLLLTAAYIIAALTVGAQILVKDIDPGSGSGYPNNFINFNNYLYFVASDGVHGFELWKTDGTDDGTQMVKDIAPGPDNGMAEDEDGLAFSNFTIMNNELYFFANDDSTGFELWKSDGTETGTVQVKDIYPGDTGSVDLNPPMIVMGNNLYFAATSSNRGQTSSLWKSDGTTGGTVLVKGMGDSYFNPAGFFAWNNTLYFTAEYDSAGGTLWKTDGTTGGTVVLKDADTINYNGYYTNFFVYGNTIYFTTYETIHGQELWTTDGTPEGTHIALDIAPGPFGSNPQYIILFNNKMMFCAGNLADGSELWVSDGTAQGTTELKDINTTGAEASSNPTELTIFGNRVFFQADDGIHGAELWVTDGTAGGTVLFKDLNTTTTTYPGSYPENFTVVNDTMYFDADDSVHGRELWLSDGTAAGTMMVSDLRAGSDGSYPYQLTPYKNMVLFGADDYIIGDELYRMGSLLTGIEEVPGSVAFRIQPNPAKNYVTILTDGSAIDSKVQLMDMAGRQISSFNLVGSACQFNTSALPAGMYLIKLTGQQGETGVKKLVVE